MNSVTVIYEKKTGRVLITEQNGEWTLPRMLDILKVSEGANVFKDDGHGNIFVDKEVMEMVLKERAERPYDAMGDYRGKN